MNRCVDNDISFLAANCAFNIRSDFMPNFTYFFVHERWSYSISRFGSSQLNCCRHIRDAECMRVYGHFTLRYTYGRSHHAGWSHALYKAGYGTGGCILYGRACLTKDVLTSDVWLRGECTCRRANLQISLASLKLWNCRINFLYKHFDVWANCAWCNIVPQYNILVLIEVIGDEET